MAKLNDIKVGTKLLGGFAIVAAVSVIVGWLGIKNMHEVEKGGEVMYSGYTIPLGQAGEMNKLFQRIRVNSRDIVLAEKPEEQEKYHETIKDLREKITKVADEYETSITEPEDREAFNAFKGTRVAYGADLDKVISLALQNRDAERTAAWHRLNTLRATLPETSDEELMREALAAVREVREDAALERQTTSAKNR